MTSSGEAVDQAAEPPPQRPLFEVVAAELDREVASGIALGTRAMAVVAFVGVLLTLVAGRIGMFFDDCLSKAVQRGLVGSLVLVVALLVAATALAISVLLPHRRGRTKPQVFRDLRTQNPPERELHDRLVQSLIKRYENETNANDTKGKRLRSAYVLTLTGLITVVIQALVLGATQGANSCTETQKTTRPTGTRTTLQEAIHPSTTNTKILSTASAREIPPAGSIEIAIGSPLLGRGSN